MADHLQRSESLCAGRSKKRRFQTALSVSAGFKASFSCFFQKMTKMVDPRGEAMHEILGTPTYGISRMSGDRLRVHFSLFSENGHFGVF